MNKKLKTYHIFTIYDENMMKKQKDYGADALLRWPLRKVSIVVPSATSSCAGEIRESSSTLPSSFTIRNDCKSIG